jgi:hypothetical protein
MNAPLHPDVVVSDFAEELARLDSLIAREIARLRARYELSLDEFRGLYVSDEQVDALVRHAAPALVDQPSPPPPVPAEGTRWHHLQHALAVTRAELDVLLMVLAPELDPKYEVLFAYLNNDVTRKLPTCELASRLFASDAAERLALRAYLAPDAALFSCGAVEFAAATRELPRPQRGLRVPGALADWLLGLNYADERLVGVASRPPEPAFASAARAAVPFAQLLETTMLATAMPLVLTAPSAAEAARSAQCALGATRPLMLDLMALRSAPSAADCVNALLLMQTVQGAPIIASPLDALADADGRPLEAASLVRRLARRARPLVLAASQTLRWRDIVGDGTSRVLELPLGELDTRERAATWRAALAALQIDHIDDDVLLALSDRFALGLDRIEQAAQHAADTARLRGDARPTANELFAAARAASADSGADVVRPVRQHFVWDDLVIPLETRQRLEDLLHAVNLRPQVFDRWNFRQPCGGQRGIKAMFAGASGTGKTMAAAIIARELGLDLHRVELAAVMSKYIGETEKNLERAFAAARRANAILFIDEADALLGKRSEVKDAHDRYANVEIAFLLQKMEDHDGVVIVATNLANNIDAAFSRRMHFVVQFPLPDPASRERLWQRMLPAAAPRAADLDIGFLARQFEFSGGDIRNIALDAAFRAAHAGAPIGMRVVLTAVISHYTKRGRLPHANEFGPYASLLRAAQPPPHAQRTAA